MRKFFVFDEAKKGDANWDTFCGMFDTQEQAVAEAERIWRHLTDDERKKRTVCAAYADIPDDFIIDDDCKPEDAYLGYALDNGYYATLELS